MNAHDAHKNGADALNRQDLDGFVGIYSTNAIVNDPAYPEPLKGHDAIRKDMSDFFTAFPDLQGRLVNSISGADGIAGEWIMTGTHKGPLSSPTGTIEATNKKVEIKLATFSKLDGSGRIVEERRYYDLASFIGQLGIA
jgi:steroid delta-isomerase-like uncharacterized protein